MACRRLSNEPGLREIETRRLHGYGRPRSACRNRDGIVETSRLASDRNPLDSRPCATTCTATPLRSGPVLTAPWPPEMAVGYQGRCRPAGVAFARRQCRDACAARPTPGFVPAKPRRVRRPGRQAVPWAGKPCNGPLAACIAISPRELVASIRAWRRCARPWRFGRLDD